MTDERDLDPLPDDDPVRDLARLFGALEPAEVGGDLEDEDALTREAVALLRDAWERTEPEVERVLRPLPPVQPGQPGQPGPGRSAATLTLPLAVVLAAAAAVIAFTSILDPSPERGDSRRSPEVSLVAELEPRPDPVTPPAPANATPEPAEPSTAQETPPRPRPEVDVGEDGQLVVRSGPVRLFLAARLPDERTQETRAPETER